jgi:hypothetical protein
MDVADRAPDTRAEDIESVIIDGHGMISVLISNVFLTSCRKLLVFSLWSQGLALPQLMIPALSSADLGKSPPSRCDFQVHSTYWEITKPPV